MVCLGCFTTTGATTTSQVYEYIATDQIDRARQVLAALIRSEYANPERLYLSGVLAAEADSSISYYRRALELAKDQDVIAASLIGSANYYLIRGVAEPGLDLIDKYRKQCDDSPHYAEVLRLRALLRFAVGKQWKSRGELQKVYKRETDARQIGLLALSLGDVYRAQGKYDQAAEYYRDLANRSNRRFFGAAALRFIETSFQTGDDDNAMLTYNMLKSQNPLTLGLDRVGAALGETATSAITEIETEELGSSRQSTHAIRVGTYSELVAAEAQQRRFAVQGYTARISRVRISGSNYYVVDLGEFSSQAEANQVMERLAADNRDTYHVVTF